MGIDQTTEFKVMMTNELSIKIFNFLATRAGVLVLVLGFMSYYENTTFLEKNPLLYS